MPLYFQLTQSQPEIQKIVYEALCKEMNKHFRGMAAKLKPQFQKVVTSIFEKTETYESLLSGELRGEFGFPSGTETRAVKAILKAIKDDLWVGFNKFTTNGNTIEGGITVFLVKATLEELFKEPEASHRVVANVDGYTSFFDIPWLEWLLVDGDRVIIQDYTFIHKFAGRSAHGIMAATKKPQYFYRVHPGYAGTINDNWVTRTLDDYMVEFAQAWGEILMKECET